MSEKYCSEYYNDLYSLQDEVFKIIEDYDFYLTGGTASNKLTAITRLEPKDIADIWFICKNQSFRWDEIIREAEQKEAIEELLVFDLLKTFPVQMFRKIRWIDPINEEEFEIDKQVILRELISKESNSLYQRYEVQKLH